MQTNRNTKETGNVLICVLGAILVLSLIGATVLSSTSTRLNASTNQVRAWKEALSAAETGGDIGFAELRTHVTSNPSTWWTGWTHVAGTTTYTSPVTTFGSSSLQAQLRAQTVVDECYFDSTPGPNKYKLVIGHPASGNSWYRLRSKGTAPLPNLKRTGMDDALIADGNQHFAAFGSTAMQDVTARGKGDSLLRKIDFNTDHFVATYGPNGDGLNKALVPPTVAPSISRRIEQLAMPVTPFFEAAIKAAGSFYGLGAASYIDSYNTNNNVPYDSTVKTNPASPYYSDSRHGNVEIDSATVTVKGSIYGNVATNGGNVTQGNPGTVYGTIDNNVPFTQVPFVMPAVTSWDYQSNPTSASGNQTLTPTATGGRAPGGTSIDPIYYLFTSFTGALTINPAVVSGASVETYVAIHVAGDFTGGITVNPKVHAKIFFDGNLSTKAMNIVNQSPNSAHPLSGPYSGNLQFYGISPTTPGQTQSIDLGPGGGQIQTFATFYAPSADFNLQGAPDYYGTVVCKTFYANGNVTWHYDRALNDDGQILDFRIASYVEDTR